MVISLAFIFLFGLLLSTLFKAIKLPHIIGILLAGIVIGPFCLNLLDDSILSVSSDLRQIALIIILLKAGLSLNLSDLKKVGRPAILMAFLPAALEIIAYVVFAPLIFKISRIDAAVMGSVLAAVSPAVVVPQMLKLMDEKRSTGKSIPQLIMAGASCDDIFVIILFSAFCCMAQGGSASVMDFAHIPISIILGVLLGIVIGFALYLLFSLTQKHNHSIPDTVKVVLILGFAFLMMGVELWLKGIVSVSGLLAVVAMGCVIKTKTYSDVTEKLSSSFGKLWVAAELILFVLVGASVDISYTLTAGASALLMIAIALVFRSIGVMLCLIKTKLNFKERLFCVIAYLPKATVQAAIGAVPLAMGLPSGQIILSVAVLAILITAPLGAIGIKFTKTRLLNDDSLPQPDMNTP